LTACLDSASKGYKYIDCNGIADYSRLVRLDCGPDGRNDHFMYNAQRFRTDFEYSVLAATSN